MCENVSVKQINKSMSDEDAKVGYMNKQVETCFRINRQ